MNPSSEERPGFIPQEYFKAIPRDGVPTPLPLNDPLAILEQARASLDAAPPRRHPSGIRIVESSQVPKGKMYLFPRSQLVFVPPRPAPNALDRTRLRLRHRIRRLLRSLRSR